MPNLPTLEEFLGAVRHTMTALGGAGIVAGANDPRVFWVAVGVTAAGYAWSYLSKPKAQ